jgi:hypothetical protein
VINEVAAGVLVDAIAAAGRRLGAAVAALGGRRYEKDLALARWFDTYCLTDRVPLPAEVPVPLAGGLAKVLTGDEVQAVLHELLAARLTNAPEADVNRVRAVFGLTLATAELDDRLVPVAHSGIADADLVAELGGVLFDYFDGEICELVGRLEGHDPALLLQVRSEALATRMISILHAIERHSAALSHRPDQRTEADFLARYGRHLVEHHGKVEPPDFERRRRVPIEDIYVPPVIAQVAISDASQAPREVDLLTLDGEIDRTVLLGDPGAGKTTAANVLMHYHATQPGARVPFLVTVREYAADPMRERSVADYVEHHLETFYQCPAPPGFVSNLLVLGRAMVIFDGLDELLDAARRAEVAAAIEHFCTEYPLAPVLVTSRVVGYDQARLDDRQFACYRIAGFSADQVTDYVRKWFTHDPDVEAGEAERWANAFMGESASVLDLLSNPLVLALMCILYRGEGSLPRNRAEVYEQCANLLFRKWDARRHIYLSLRAGHLVESALRHLAWWLLSRDQGQPAVTERQLVNETAAFLHGRGFESEGEARDAAAEFIAFCRGRMWVFSDIGTTASGDVLYGFTHRTFLEYFAAAHLACAHDTPEQLARVLAPHVARHEWEVVSELAVQIKDRTSDQGAQRAYVTLLNERRRRSAAGRGGVLQFLARGLRSVDPPPHVIRDLTRAILGHLLAGSLDDPDRYLPLSWLLASCASTRDIVSSEINACAADMTSSADHEIHMNGLRLAVSQADGISHIGRDGGPRVPPGSPLAQFWRERQEENIRTYADAITAAASEDGWLRGLGLDQNLIAMSQALQMPGELTALFRQQAQVLFGTTWVAYMPNMITSLALGWGEPGPDDSEPGTHEGEVFAAVGQHLISHPGPPWVHGRLHTWANYFWGHPARRDTSQLTLEPVTYLGAAATLLIITECEQPVTPPSEGPERLGPLRELYPYIARRSSCDPSPNLTDLPVPQPFQLTFRNWAENRVNFAESETVE